MTLKKNKTGLQSIPGIGPSMEEDLIRMGITEISQLEGKDPQRLYEQLCAIEGKHVDRCVLYVFRCAVYFASHIEHDSEKLKWWNWKD